MRFTPIRVFLRGDDQIAQILDQKSGRMLYVNRPDNQLKNWDRPEFRHIPGPVRRLAKEMLLDCEGESGPVVYVEGGA